jgi:hypothetical protein
VWASLGPLEMVFNLPLHFGEDRCHPSIHLHQILMKVLLTKNPEAHWELHKAHSAEGWALVPEPCEMFVYPQGWQLRAAPQLLLLHLEDNGQIQWRQCRWQATLVKTPIISDVHQLQRCLFQSLPFLPQSKITKTHSRRESWRVIFTWIRKSKAMGTLVLFSCAYLEFGRSMMACKAYYLISIATQDVIFSLLTPTYLHITRYGYSSVARIQ